MDAYNCRVSAYNRGRLAGDPDVSNAINDLMHQEGIGRHYRVKRLRDVINAADLGIVSRGLNRANKLTGEYAPKKIDINEQIRVTHLLIAEIKGLRKVESQDDDDDLF